MEVITLYYYGGVESRTTGGGRGGVVVKVRRYKPEGRGFDFLRCY